MDNGYSIIVIIFFGIVVFIGAISSVKIRNSKDWLVAGQSLGIIPSIGTYFATIVSSVSMIAYVGYCYFNGWGGIWIFSGTFLTSVLAIFFFAGALRKTGCVSVPNYLEVRFGKTEAAMVAVLVLISSLFMLCAQLTAGGIVLKMVTGWNQNICIIVLCGIIVFLTSFGGMFSVAWTDTFCALAMFAGIWIMAVIMLRNVGGFSEMQHTLMEIDERYMDLMSISIPMALSWVFTWGLGNYGMPHFVARFFSAKDERTARISQAWCIVLFCLFYFPIAIVGLAGIILAPGIKSQDDVTVTMIQLFCGDALGGFIFAAILAACISTADSILLMASGTVSNDIYRRLINPNVSAKRILYVSKCSVWIIGILAVIMALMETKAVLWIQAQAVTIMGAALSPSIMIGAAWKRANAVGGISSFAIGLGMAVIWYALDQPFGLMPMMPAFAVGAVSMVIGTLVGDHYERHGRKNHIDIKDN